MWHDAISGAHIIDAVARAATDGVIVSVPDGTILEFNAVAERIFGRARADVVGRKLIDVVVPPELQDAHRAAIARHGANPGPMTRVMRFTTLGQHADGSTFPIEVSLAVAHTDGAATELVVTYVRDRVVRSTAIDDGTVTGEIPDHARELLKAAPVIVFTIDRAGTIEVFLGGALAQIGADASVLIGRNIYSVRPHRAELYDTFKRAVGGANFRTMIEFEGRFWDTQFQPTHDENGVLTGSLGICIDATAQVVVQNALRMLAETDTVTGLASRRHAESALSARLADGNDLALLLVDLDGFKDVNDSYGHAVGDAVLSQLGTRLRRAVPEHAVLGRLGGDELVVGLLSADPDEVAGVADAVLSAVAQPIRVGYAELPDTLLVDISITASIGIACAPGDGTTTADLLAHADSAMYAAKQSGGAAHRWYSADADRARRRLEVSTKLRGAIAAKAIDVEFQPLIRLSDNVIIGFEALARWADPELGIVSPDEFVALAGTSPLIDDLFDVVLDKALDAMVRWNGPVEPGAVPRAADGTLVGIGLNIAPRQLRDRRLPERVVQAANAAGVTPACVVLELTETALVEDSTRTSLVFKELRNAGIHLAIDDFGVGYSNMARLSDLTASGTLATVKIDRTFVADLPGERSMTLLRSIIGMIGSLGLKAVAEGVESVEQLDALRALGCECAQGWLFARPMTADEAVRLVAAERERMHAQSVPRG